MRKGLIRGQHSLSSSRTLITRLNRIPSFNLENKHNTDQVVEELRAKYPDYRRCKLQPFTAFVTRTLDSHHKSLFSSANKEYEHAGNSGVHISRRRRCKKIDIDDELMLHYESEFLQRKKQGHKPLASSSSFEDDDASISEDAIFEDPVEPEFDIMKSMLRSNYEALNSKELDKNVEVEAIDKSSKIHSLMTLGQGKQVDDMQLHSVELKGNQGPTFKDLGGMKGVLDELMTEVIFPLYHPQLLQRLGVKPITGILLHGPPGCGKTTLAHAIANETGVSFYEISATEVVSGVSGASEENIRDLFSKAYRTAPSIVFIDEIDAIASKREELQRQMERRIVTQLMTCMDAPHQILRLNKASSNAESIEKPPSYVLVIGATNNPDAVDPALRRPGRFDREIVLGVPDENARAEILSVLTQSLMLDGIFDLTKIARSTPGFVGADLVELVNKAGRLALKRIIDERKSELSKEYNVEKDSEGWLKKPLLHEELEKVSITMADFVEATKMVQPSSKREGFSTVPNVKWEDVGGLSSLRKEFDRYIVKGIKHRECYEEFEVDLETGFLLYGPPGCGKTLIAKAVANEAGTNFIHIKGPELLNKYVGESELAIRTIFSRARTCAPCILFFDEVDALTTKRGKDGGWVVERLLNQLLIELDGADQRRGVFVIGATNRPDVMDRAVLRPGRFGKLIYVPLPNAYERGLILKALAKKKPFADDVNLQAIGESEACHNLSGADLAALMNEAAMLAVEEKQMALNGNILNPNQWFIKSSHFQQALKKVSPSVSDKQKNYYEALSRSFKASYS